MTRILIVYATREGRTAKIAHHIADSLEKHASLGELFDADEPPGRRISPPSTA